MPNLRVKFTKSPTFAKVDAVTVEDDKENFELRAKDAMGHVIARFNSKEIDGWWIEPQTKEQEDDAKLIQALEEGRKRAALRNAEKPTES